MRNLKKTLFAVVGIIGFSVATVSKADNSACLSSAGNLDTGIALSPFTTSQGLLVDNVYINGIYEDQAVSINNGTQCASCCENSHNVWQVCTWQPVSNGTDAISNLRFLNTPCSGS